jgi:hypothetical protein
MKTTPDNFYNFSPEIFKDEQYDDVIREFPKDTLIYITTTKQVGLVEDVRATADGVRIKVKNIGSVPIDEIRVATEEEIKNSRFEKDQ